MCVCMYEDGNVVRKERKDEQKGEDRKMHEEKEESMLV